MAGEGFVAAVAGGELRGWLEGAGPPVLALHGGPGLSFDYLDDMVHELSASYRVATYQQRGMEPSTTEGPFSVPQEVDDACAVLDALGWERAWVVGHSWGGHLVLHLAVRRPQRLLGALSVDPLGAVGDGGVGVMSERMGAWLSAHGGEPPPDADAVERLRRVWPAYFADPDAAPPMPAIRSAPEAAAGVWESITEEMPALAAKLGEVDVPVGFVAGSASPLSVGAGAGPTADAMPGSWLEVVEGAGHFPWVEKPGCVRAGLDRLVAGAPERG